MDRLRNIGNLLLPSLSSAVAVVGIGLLILGVTTFASSNGSGTLYDWLFGANSSTAQIETARNTIDSISKAIFGNMVLNQLLFFVLWMLIGLAVYVILAGVNREVSTVNELREQLHYANVRPAEMRREFAIRLVVRWIVLAGWGIYWVVFVKIYFPFSILCAHIGVADLEHLSGWLFGAAGLITLILSLHLHVIFARLLVLRTRLFSSD